MIELSESLCPTEHYNCKGIRKAIPLQGRVLKKFILEYHKSAVKDLTVIFSSDRAHSSARAVCRHFSEFGFKACVPLEKPELTIGEAKTSGMGSQI
jgi:hypothetical protein